MPPTHPKIEQAIQLAVAHHEAGRLREAAAIYRRVLKHDVGNARALHFLGVIAHQIGRRDIAMDLIGRSIQADPDNAGFQENFGNLLAKQGRLDEAVAAYRQAIAADPTYAAAHTHLGAVLAKQGKLSEAVAVYRRAVELGGPRRDYELPLPTPPVPLAPLAPLTPLAPEPVAPAPLVEPPALPAAPAAAPAGVVNSPGLATDTGVVDASIVPAAVSEPAGAAAVAPPASVPIRPTRRRPASAESLRSRGMALMRVRKLDEAAALFARAIALQPASADAHRDLGAAFLRQGKLDRAVASIKRALELRPIFPEAWGSLGDAYHLEGKLDQAIACYQKLLELNPTAAKVHSNLLLTMNYHPRYEPRRVFAEHLRWAEQHAGPLAAAIRPHPNDRTPGRRLRIGYVSPDFRRHSVNYFIEPVLAAHDHAHFAVICYSDVIRPDHVTEHLAHYSDTWREIRTQSDEQVAELVRRDRVDILVDLSGHTGNNRMGVFARKPAPVQVTYLGYPNTTGLSTMDYRITDARADPPGAAGDALYTEKLVRLPGGFLCYQPPAECPDVGEPPCLSEPFVTFGCFNVLAKVTPQVMSLWARIMHAVPRSRLVLKGRAGALGHKSRRQYVKDIFAYHGIAAERLTLHQKEPSYAEHLARYQSIDIALDPFPYNGTTTTCEALWMGLPVVTLAGDHHVARVGVSILSRLGLTELVATTPEQYVQIAVEQARHPRGLALLRADLRDRMLRSTLTDAPRFTRTLESAYREMWLKWCAAIEAPVVARA